MPPTMGDRILDAALAVFTERTYGGAAVPLIADRAGVSVGSVYRSFASKDEMANAVYRRAKQRMLDSIARRRRPRPGRTRARARSSLAAWAGLAAYAASDPDGFAFLEHQQHAAYLDDESRAVARRVDDLAADIVRAGQAAPRRARRQSRPPRRPGLRGLRRSHEDRAGIRVADSTAADIDSSGEAVWAMLARPAAPITAARAAGSRRRTS